jgi:hypothetical protein
MEPGYVHALAAYNNSACNANIYTFRIFTKGVQGRWTNLEKSKRILSQRLLWRQRKEVSVFPG